MNYKNVIVTSIKDDVIKHKIVITVEVDRQKDNLRVAEELSIYCGKDPQNMEVVFTPYQIKLFPSDEKEED